MIIPPPSQRLLSRFKEFLEDPEVSSVLRDLCLSVQANHPDAPMDQDWQQLNQYAHVQGYQEFYRDLYNLIPAFESVIEETSLRSERERARGQDEEDSLSRKLTY